MNDLLIIPKPCPLFQFDQAQERSDNYFLRITGIYLCAMHDSGSTYARVLHECCSTVERLLNSSHHGRHFSQLLAVLVRLQSPLLDDYPYTASRLAGDGRTGVTVVDLSRRIVDIITFL